MPNVYPWSLLQESSARPDRALHSQGLKKGTPELQQRASESTHIRVYLAKNCVLIVPPELFWSFSGAFPEAYLECDCRCEPDHQF